MRFTFFTDCWRDANSSGGLANYFHLICSFINNPNPDSNDQVPPSPENHAAFEDIASAFGWQIQTHVTYRIYDYKPSSAQISSDSHRTSIGLHSLDLYFSKLGSAVLLL